MSADSLAKNTQMLPQNLSAQAQKFWISMKKRLHWASIVRDKRYGKNMIQWSKLYVNAQPEISILNGL